jgi:hypothetical protein
MDLRIVTRRLALPAMVLVLAACSATPPRGSAGTPAAPPATVAATSAPLASPNPSITATATIADGWRPVPEQASVQGVQFQSVVWTGTRFVATGLVLGGDGAFLDSPDGLIWHLQASTQAKMYPAQLASGPRGVVAVGTIDNRPASWFSPDGLRWTVHADAFSVPAIGTDTVQVTAAVATNGGWLAGGREDPFCNMNCGLAPVRALAWTSSDGLHWSRIRDQASLGGAAMTGVARGGPGFVAVGLAGTHAAAWTSADGATWSRVPDAPLFHELPSADPSLWTTMSGVAAGPGGLVAVGYEGNGGAHGPAARAWWSTDGLTWSPADGEGFASGGEVDVRLGSVTPTSAGFLAVGISTGGCRPGIWASSDGRAWRCVASDPAFTGFGPYAAAASSSVEVAVGLTSVLDPSPNGLPGAVWRRTLP